MKISRRSVLRSTGLIAGSAAVTAVVRGDARQSDETWETMLGRGGEAYADAAARDDRGFVVAGRANATDGGQEFWVVELGSDSDWRAVATFDRENDGTVDDVVPAPDGAVVVGVDLGPEDDLTANHTPYVTKVGADGVQWTRTKTPEEADENYSVGGVTRTADGDYVVAGARGIRDADAWTLRIAGDGSVVRERTVDRERPTAFDTVTAGPDGGVIAGGSVGQIRERAAWLTVVDADGNDRWERTYEERDGVRFTRVRRVLTDDDALALSFDGIDGDEAGPVVAAADGEGSLRWTDYLFTSQFTAAEAIAPVEAGYVVGGNYVTTTSEHDYWLAAVSRDGGVRWLARYDDSGFLGDVVGDGSHAIFAGQDGEAATARRFNAATVPWRERTASRGTTTTGDATATAPTAGTAEDDVTARTSTAGTTGDETTADETATTGTPGFGVGEAVTGIAALEVLRRWDE